MFKLGLVTGEFPPMQGGVGDYTHELAKALAALGVEVHVITTTQSQNFPPATFHLHPSIRSWSFASLFQIRALAKQLNLQSLILQYQTAAYKLSAPIHFLPKIAGIKTIVTFHDLRIPYLFPKAGALRQEAVTFLARSAAGAIVTDPADETELRRRGIQHVTQIPIGSNIACEPPADFDRDAVRAKYFVTPNDFLLGYFGFLNPSKGGTDLIQAVAALVDRKARAKLLLIGGEVGSSDPANVAFNAEIDQLIKRYGLENRVFRTGFVTNPEVSAHLLACDAMVLPYKDGASFRRGTLMAALAHGCPIITTQPQTPQPEWRDGENVRLVPAGSVSALVLAVTELLDAPEIRARLGQGAKTLSTQFQWDAIAERTLKFVESV